MEQRLTDCELLVLAAKAAGDVELLDVWKGEFAHFERNGYGWNPLTGDGDALRLAVRLKLLVDVDGEVCSTACDGTKDNEQCETHNGDPYAATRRAIVRAAAAIGAAK